MIKYAIIGCGCIGNVHCAAIIEQNKSHLEVVCDIVEEKAKKLADIYKCRYTTDYLEVLNDSNVDAVAICLPHHKHLSFFEEALSHGKHVVCEKPMAINPKSILQMVKASEDSTLQSTIAFQHRHSPLVIELKRYLDKGYFGEILEAVIDFKCKRTMEYYNSADWRGKWETEGGGILINQAIHTIDLACHLLGNPCEVEGNVMNNGLPLIEVEDYAVGRIALDNGIEIELKAENSEKEGWQPFIYIKGSKGSFTLEGSESFKSIQLESKEELNSLLKIEKEMNQFNSHHGKQEYSSLHDSVYSDFTNSILESRSPLVSVNDAAIANYVVLAFYQSTTESRLVKLPLIDYEHPVLID